MRRWCLGLALLATACAAPLPRPSVLGRFDHLVAQEPGSPTHEGAQGRQVEARRLRSLADAAFQQGDRAGAQFLGERAVEALAEARALERAHLAALASSATTERLMASRSRLQGLEADLAAKRSTVRQLELRLKVERETPGLVPSELTSPARNRAREQAAQGLEAEALVLCEGARLLRGAMQASSPRPAPVSSLPSVGPTKAARIDRATRARARCLQELSDARNELPASWREFQVDCLRELARLSPEELRASVDARGLVLELRPGRRTRGSALDELLQKALGLLPPSAPRLWVGRFPAKRPAPRLGAMPAENEARERLSKLVSSAGGEAESSITALETQDTSGSFLLVLPSIAPP